MIALSDYIQSFPSLINANNKAPWDITASIIQIINDIIPLLPDDYLVNDGVAIHGTAVIEKGVTLKAPAIIGPNCFIGAHAYLRGGVFLANHVSIGPGCEIKSSIICEYAAMAHFNFIGDSIIGSHANFEAGSITANHFNERMDKTISVKHNDAVMKTGVKKFGSLVGDRTKVGANAVLSPGTLLPPNSVVKRLELVEQVPTQ